MSIVLVGATSGSVTLQEPAVAGNTVITLPSTSGTLLQSGTPVTVAQGGIGATATPTNGQIPIGNGTNYTPATLTAGSGISITNGAGSISIAAASTGLPGAQGQAFTSSGTFTIPTGITAIKVTVVGGGGGGGRALSGDGQAVGSGGGGGGYSIQFFTGLTSGNTLSVTVGAAGTGGTSGGGGTGGTSSVASGTQSITTVSATGGAGGDGTTDGQGSPRTGGIGSGGAINGSGFYGWAERNGATGNLVSWGGSCAYGSGGIGGSSAGRAFGGGGAGGIISGGGSASGGAGAAGVVFIEW